MKLRSKSKAEKIEPQMAPMIDVVFQLLIFFMLTLKIIPPEGDFNINMPLGGPPSQNSDVTTPPVQVALSSDADGNLTNIQFGQRSLGNNPEQVFPQLNQLILTSIGGRPGGPASKETEVEIDADPQLDYLWTIKAVGAVMGKFDAETGEVVRYVEKVKFAPPN